MGLDSKTIIERPLRREVVYPQQQSTGVGVMLVASAAMFFAVASSAFILRAQMPAECSPPALGSSIVVPVTVVETTEARTEPRLQETLVESCGEPYYQENSDSSVSIFFNICSQ